MMHQICGVAARCTRIVPITLLVLLLSFSYTAAAQRAGPLSSHPPNSQPVTESQQGPLMGVPREQPLAESPVTTEPLSVPIDQIIQRFGAQETEFKQERDNYTYTQTFVIQTLDSSDQVDGEYRMKSEIMFTPSGKRYEKVTYAPPPTLQRISLSQQDVDDLEHVQPFVLTTQELPKYDVQYVGKQKLDELTTYVFDVAPKQMEKNQRYFKGRIWVDEKDLEIVKSDGKAVPDIRKKGEENVFPRFETFRENIKGRYWFPTYTHSEDTLQFSGGAVRIRMSVRYENYKRFGVTVKIGPATEVK